MQPHIKKWRLSVFWDCFYICRTGSFSGFTSPAILSYIIRLNAPALSAMFSPRGSFTDAGEFCFLETWQTWSEELTGGIVPKVCSGKWFSVYFDLGYCCSLFLVTSSTTSLAVWIFLPLSFEFLTPCLRSRMCFIASTLQPVEYRRGSNVFLVADMSTCLPVVRNKETSPNGLLSAFLLFVSG